jgi:hypothetical protein
MSDPIVWAQLPPSERDALVALHIFGRKIVKWKEDRVLLMEREGAAGHEAIPPYSTSMDAAWQILQVMAKHEDRSRFMHLMDEGDLASKDNLEFQLWEILIHVATWTPERIAVAALKVHGLEFEV